MAGVVSLALAVAACSDETPEPDPVAESLARTLETGAADVTFTNAAPDDVESELEEVVGNMGEVPRSVEVTDLEPVEDENAYTATFDVEWSLDGATENAGDSEDAEDSGDIDDSGDAADGENAGDAADDPDGSDDAGGDLRWSYTSTARLSLVEDGENGAGAWQVEWTPAVVHPDLESGDRLRMDREQAERADIIGADGEPLVTERDVYRIGVDKTRFDDDATEDEMVSVARELAELVGVDGERLAERVRATGERAFVEAITFREDDAAPVLDEIDAIDGAVALPDMQPLAPTREFARPLLGTVGKATAEIIEESNGNIQTGDVVGLSGLQQAYDEQLRGTPGVSVEIVSEDDDAEPSVVFEQEPEPGEPLAITLDAGLQQRAESVLADVGPPSAIVAVEPSTSRILAAASGPGGEGYSTATAGQYAPGSTFKMVTALALLRAGLDGESTVVCPSTLTVDGREFGNYSGYPDSALGDISLETAIAESCNTALMGERDQVSQEDLVDAGAALGFGLEHQSHIGAFGGSMPREAEGTSHAASMIGQGEVLASPLAMAGVAASVVAGEAIVPHLLDDDTSADADSEELAAPSEPLSGGEAAQLQKMMYAAVEYGSASFLQDVPGEPVGAKTGTAEYGSGDEAGTHGWMIAFQGDLAVAVFVEEGESGARAAGPPLEDFLSGR
ncbi:penicillin-binding transpeptidase domain-containing protein [Phytoactinopolyspora halophila]|nr:penicillin-binding transpeptidase domain-containing protein [Phytoactinopolyspora halophila]